MKNQSKRKIGAGGNSRLFNLIFPVWLLWLIPVTWVVVVPANFIIDLLVVFICPRRFKIEKPFLAALNSITKVFLFGFLSDFIGTAVLLGAQIFESPLSRIGQGNASHWWYENITSAISTNPFTNPLAFIVVALAVFISAFFIYQFNKHFSFKNAGMSQAQRKRASLMLAVFTAPYLFLLPTVWFY